MTQHADLVPVRQIAAHELVVDQIRRSMESGRFQPGDRLPPERDLAEMLDVSRTTVRAAIAVLESEGRVSVRRGRGGGFTVLEPLYDPVQARGQLRRNRVAVRDAFDYRIVVESGAARLASERRKAADLQRLADVVGRMGEALAEAAEEQSTGLVTRFQALDSAFHVGIARASGNQYLVDAVTEARRAMWLPVGSIFGRLESGANDHHAEILAAIRNQEPDLAAATMAAHINATRFTIEAWLHK